MINNYTIFPRGWLLFILLTSIQAMSVWAAENSPSSPNQTPDDWEKVIIDENDSSNHPLVLDFIDMMAEKYRDISRERLIGLFKQIQLDNPIKKRLSNNINNPAEKVLNWDKYSRQFLKKERIQSGVIFYKKHRTLLKQINEHFSVPIPIILATLGIESYFGRAEYRYPVFLSLAINSFVNNYRSKFYRRQLEYFLVIAHRNDYDDDLILTLRGSYSSAIGPAQFIPFSIFHYGYDFDGDDRVNMLDNYPDILASIANYYYKNGWKHKRKIITKLSPPCQPGKGILVYESGGKTQCWKKEYNFSVILSYNHNNFYALSLYLLARELDRAIKEE